MPLSGKLTSFLLSTTMLGGPISGGAADATLLAGETDGLAIDWTATTDFALSTWGMQAVQERNASVDTLQSPHVFFTQSGTSPKYVKTSATTIGWSPHNIAVQSQDIATTWVNGGSTEATNSTTAPDGTATADTIIEDNGSTRHIVSQNVSGTISGVVYTASVYLKRKDRQWGFFGIASDVAIFHGIVIDLDTGNVTDTRTSSPAFAASSVTGVGSGWYRVTVTYQADHTLTYLQFSASDSATPAYSFNCPTWAGDSASGIYVWGMQLNRGHSATSYIATTSAAKIGLPISYGEGLLVEPAATNLCLQSQTLGSATWTKTATTVSADATTSPDGSTTADDVVASGAGTGRFVRQDFTLSTTTAYTLSVYLKKNVTDWAAVYFIDSGGGFAGSYFDLTNGALGNSFNATWAAPTRTITSIGSGWYRCSIAATTAADAAVNIRVELADGNSDNNVDDLDSVYMWGAQLELGSVATSYIPTIAATATRAVDNISVATSAIGSFDNKPATAYASFVLRDETAAGIKYVYTFTAGASDILVYKPNASANIRCYSNAIVEVTAGNYTPGSTHQISFAWDDGDYDASMDGAALASSSAAGAIPALPTLSLGGEGTSFPLNGFLKKFVYVPRQVQTQSGNLTTWRYVA